MKKINIKSKGYNLTISSTQEENVTKVCVDIPGKSRKDRMTYWTYEELANIVNQNMQGIGKRQSESYDLFYALEEGSNKVEIIFEKQKEKNAVIKTKPYQKRSKKS